MCVRGGIIAKQLEVIALDSRCVVVDTSADWTTSGGVGRVDC